LYTPSTVLRKTGEREIQVLNVEGLGKMKSVLFFISFFFFIVSGMSVENELTSIHIKKIKLNSKTVRDGETLAIKIMLVGDESNISSIFVEFKDPNGKTFY
jgi:hypothetical protein